MSTDAPIPSSGPESLGRGGDPREVRGRRIGAVFIDAALLIVPSVLIAFAFLEKRTDISACGDIDTTLKSCFKAGDNFYVATDGRFLAWQGVSLLLGFAYYALLQGSTGWTLGKLMVGVRVVDRTGSRCGVGRAFLRYLPFLGPALVPVVGGIIVILMSIAEFVLILAHPRSQRLGDMLGKTYVIAADAVGHPVRTG